MRALAAPFAERERAAGQYSLHPEPHLFVGTGDRHLQRDHFQHDAAGDLYAAFRAIDGNQTNYATVEMDVSGCRERMSGIGPGAGANNWSAAGNWSPAGPPAAIDSVRVFQSRRGQHGFQCQQRRGRRLRRERCLAAVWRHQQQPHDFHCRRADAECRGRPDRRHGDGQRHCANGVRHPHGPGWDAGDQQRGCRTGS